MGDRVGKSFKAVTDTAINARRAAAKTDFGLIDSAAGGKKVIPVQNVLDTLDGLIKKYDVPGGGDASATIVSRLKSLKSAWAGTPEKTVTSPIVDAAGRPITSIIPAQPARISGQNAQRLMQIYSDAATGKGKIFADLDTAQQRMIARDVLHAMGRDLDGAATAAGDSGPVAAALQRARSNYAANSQKINDLGDSVLGKMFGAENVRSPERITEAMRNMRPSELKASFAILGQHAPETSQAVKRSFFENALAEAGQPQSTSAPSMTQFGEPTFSAAKYLQVIKQSPVWDILTPAERTNAMASYRAIERIKDSSAGLGSSQTAPLQFVWQMVKGLGNSARALDVVGAGRQLGGLAFARSLADQVTTDAGRKALITISITKPGTKAFSGAAAYLATLLAREPEGEDIRPDSGFDAALRADQTTQPQGQ